MTERKSERKNNSFRYRPKDIKAWVAFKNLCNDTGIFPNEGIERLVRQALDKEHNGVYPF